METIDMRPGGTVLNIEKGQWHSFEVLGIRNNTAGSQGWCVSSTG